MRSRVATLVAACFALAVARPPAGLVLHQHAGGDAPHVHEHHRPHHHHHNHGAGQDQHHDHDHDHHHHHAEPGSHEDAPARGSGAGPALRAAGLDWAWHLHATNPFQHATPAPRAALAPPRAGAPLLRPRPDDPRALASIPGRSRAPPAPQSS